MSRAATSQAQTQATNAGAQAGAAQVNAAGELGQLSPQATALTKSTGYDPSTLAAITNAGMGGVNSEFGSAAGQIQRNAALTKNPAGVAGQLDTLAQNKGIAGGEEAGNIQVQNANFANEQRMAGLNLLNGLYGTNTNAGLGYTGSGIQATNAQTSASPGWAQTLSGVLSAITGAGAASGNAAIGAGRCWIAAKVFDGWNDPRTSLVRDWIFNQWAYQSVIGHLVAHLYEKYGEWVSRQPLLVRLAKPFILKALRKAQDAHSS